jgi:hypothetical protein
MRDAGRLEECRMVFFQLSEDGADDGFAEKLGLIGDFIFGAKMFDGLILRVVKQ